MRKINKYYFEKAAGEKISYWEILLSRVRYIDYQLSLILFIKTTLYSTQVLFAKENGRKEILIARTQTLQTAWTVSAFCGVDHHLNTVHITQWQQALWRGWEEEFFYCSIRGSYSCAPGNLNLFTFVPINRNTLCYKALKVYRRYRHTFSFLKY